MAAVKSMKDLGYAFNSGKQRKTTEFTGSFQGIVCKLLFQLHVSVRCILGTYIVITIYHCGSSKIRKNVYRYI